MMSLGAGKLFEVGVEVESDVGRAGDCSIGDVLSDNEEVARFCGVCAEWCGWGFIVVCKGGVDKCF